MLLCAFLADMVFWRGWFPHPGSRGIWGQGSTQNATTLKRSGKALLVLELIFKCSIEFCMPHPVLSLHKSLVVLSVVEFYFLSVRWTYSLTEGELSSGNFRSFDSEFILKEPIALHNSTLKLFYNILFWGGMMPLGLFQSCFLEMCHDHLRYSHWCLSKSV